jgi:DNA-binding transcriptional LysR family regulator
VNLRQMEVFQAVMREGTVTGGARLLGVSQPSVTEMLKHTEATLGFRLFDRIKGRLRPTPEARMLSEEAEGIFDRVSAFKRSAEALRDTQLGSLNIATISALGLSLIPSMLGRFMATRPDIRTRLLVKRRFDLIGSVVSEGIDIGFAFQSAPDPRVLRHEIARRGLIVIFPAGHELGRRSQISVADMARLPIVTYASTQGLGSMINGLFAEAGITQHALAEVEDIAQAWSLVQTGIGISIVDPFSDLQCLFPGVASRPLKSSVSLTLEALLPRQRPRSRLTDAFLASIAEGQAGSNVRRVDRGTASRAITPGITLARNGHEARGHRCPR